MRRKRKVARTNHKLLEFNNKIYLQFKTTDNVTHRTVLGVRPPVKRKVIWFDSVI